MYGAHRLCLLSLVIATMSRLWMMYIVKKKFGLITNQRYLSAFSFFKLRLRISSFVIGFQFCAQIQGENMSHQLSLSLQPLMELIISSPANIAHSKMGSQKGSIDTTQRKGSCSDVWQPFCSLVSDRTTLVRWKPLWLCQSKRTTIPDFLKGSDLYRLSPSLSLSLPLVPAFELEEMPRAW